MLIFIKKRRYLTLKTNKIVRVLIYSKSLQSGVQMTPEILEQDIWTSVY